MAQMERLYRIEQMLQNQAVVTFEHMQAALEISAATLKRDLSYLRDRLNVPVVYDRFAAGYRIDQPTQGRRFELPGVWFTADELKALLTMHKLLTDLDGGGLLGMKADALLKRIQSLMATDMANVATLLERVQLKTTGARRTANPQNFHTVSAALLQSKRLELDYTARHSNAHERRQVSPQRLTYYQDNWYLAAYCHNRKALRVFALDQMSQLTPTNLPSHLLPLNELEQATEAGYGIFLGGEPQWAELMFKGDSVRWVKDQHWHAQQQMTPCADGCLLVRVPYQNPTELAVQVMSWGPGCEVLSPPALRNQVQNHLAQALEQYNRLTP